MKRVIPRDLFNDANLLKCYGQLYLELEKLSLQDNLKYFCEGLDTQSFSIHDDCDGNTWLKHLHLLHNSHCVHMYRPMNSKDPYPLYAIVYGDSVSVFNDDGTLSQEFKQFLTGEDA